MKTQSSPGKSLKTDSAAVPAPSRASWRRHLDRTGIYGFELLMATFGLTVAAIVIDYGFFAFFSYVIGVEGRSVSANAFVGEFSLWIVAAMLVWVPLALVFYMRTRGQLAANPAQGQTGLHKVLVSLYLFVNTIIAAGALFAFLYVLIRLAVGVEDAKVGEVIGRIALPALLVVILHLGMLSAYMTSRKVTRKTFGLSFAIVAAVVMLALLVSSVGSIRGVAMDDKKQSDLRVISDKIRLYNTDKRSLPNSLADVAIPDRELKLSLDTYRYEKKGTNKYELCANFATESDANVSVISDATSTGDGYTAYPSFTKHDKGEQCFKIRVYGFNFSVPSVKSKSNAL